MSFFKIQNNSFQSFRTFLCWNFELNLNSINYFNQIWQKKEKLGLFFFPQCIDMSLSWCFRKCLVLLFLTLQFYFIFKQTFAYLSHWCIKDCFYSRSPYKVSLYRILARNTGFRHLICINKNPDLPSFCPSLCSFLSELLFLCANIPNGGTCLWSLWCLVLVIYRLQLLK